MVFRLREGNEHTGEGGVFSMFISEQSLTTVPSFNFAAIFSLLFPNFPELFPKFIRTYLFPEQLTC